MRKQGRASPLVWISMVFNSVLILVLLSEDAARKRQRQKFVSSPRALNVAGVSSIPAMLSCQPAISLMLIMA
jgi:hypothetical protein